MSSKEATDGINPTHGTGATAADPSPTMADVAAYAGMSRQTVSLVLRDAPGPSEDTRDRVLAAAGALGYRPHLAAQALRRARSTDLGVVYSPAHATEPELLEGIYAAAAERGYGVMISPRTARRGPQAAAAELLGHRCSALVVLGSDLRDGALAGLVLDTGVPVVHVGHGRPRDGYDVVRSDGADGVRQVVEHLHGLGHERIAYVHTPTLRPTAVRRSGYLTTTRRLGLTSDVVPVPGPFAEEAGAQAARTLLQRPVLPTAVVAANDQAALGVVSVLRTAGVGVPHDVSVAGFDDTALARTSFLDLTTVDQHPDRMGAAAVEAATRQVAEPGTPTTVSVTPTTLVVRGSTGPVGA